MRPTVVTLKWAGSELLSWSLQARWWPMASDWLMTKWLVGSPLKLTSIEHSTMFYKLTSHPSRQVTRRGRNVLDECANSVGPVWWSVIICHRLLLIILATNLRRLSTQDRFFRSSPYFIQNCMPFLRSTDWLTYRRWLEPFTDWRTHFCKCSAISFLFETSQSDLLQVSYLIWLKLEPVGVNCANHVSRSRWVLSLCLPLTTEACPFLWLTCLIKLWTCN